MILVVSSSRSTIAILMAIIKFVPTRKPAQHMDFLLYSYVLFIRKISCLLQHHVVQPNASVLKGKITADEKVEKLATLVRWSIIINQSTLCRGLISKFT